MHLTSTGCVRVHVHLAGLLRLDDGHGRVHHPRYAKRVIDRSGVTVSPLQCDPLPYKEVLMYRTWEKVGVCHFSFHYKLYHRMSPTFSACGPPDRAIARAAAP
jgi:hypothetical protein